MNKLFAFALLLSTTFLSAQSQVPITLRFYQYNAPSTGRAIIGNTHCEIHYDIDNRLGDTLRNGQFIWKITPALSSDLFEILEPSNATIRDSAGLMFVDFQDHIIEPNQKSKLALKLNMTSLMRADSLQSDYFLNRQNFQFMSQQGDLIQPDSVWPNSIRTYTSYVSSNLELKQNDASISEIDPTQPLTMDFSFRNRNGYDFDTLKLDFDFQSMVALEDIELESASDSLDLQWDDSGIKIFRSGLNNSGNEFFDVVLNVDFLEDSIQNEDIFDLSIMGYTSDFQFYHPFEAQQIQLDFKDKTSSLSSINKNSSDLRISPNPSSSYINFSLANASEKNLTIEIFDISGKRKLMKSVGSNFSIDKSELGNGFWFFKLKNEKGILESGKLIFVD